MRLIPSGEVVTARTGPPLDLSEGTQEFLMLVVVVALLVLLWRSWS